MFGLEEVPVQESGWWDKGTLAVRGFRMLLGRQVLRGKQENASHRGSWRNLQMPNPEEIKAGKR